MSWGLGQGCDLKPLFICVLGFGDALYGSGDVIWGLTQSDLCLRGSDIGRWGFDLRLSGL